MSNSRVYHAGIPTDVDVNKIRDAYPDSHLRAGQIIPYSEVESLLQENKNSNRWKSVTSKWRRTVESETGVIIGVERGVGFKVLQEIEKLDLCGTKLKSATRMAKRSYQVASRVVTRGLSEEQRRRLDFYVMRNSKILAASQVKSKSNLLPKLGDA